MHSCELITNLRAKKVLCHRIEVARISGATTTDCVFCNVIGYRRITPGKALSNQLNEDRGIGRRSPDPFSLERGRGLGTRLLLRYSSHMTNGILLTRHNQEIAQWSPDPFPRERVGSGHETTLEPNLRGGWTRLRTCTERRITYD